MGVVRNIVFDQHLTTVIRKTAFSFNKDRGYCWVQRLCFAVLARLGCHDMTETVEYTKTVFDGKEFVERLFASKHAVVDRFGRDGTRLIIGSDDFNELMGTKDPSYFTFISEYGYSRTIAGLKVEVVPWMQGLVVLP